LIINNNLCGILPHFRDSAGSLLKTALHSDSIRILGCSPCSLLDQRCWIPEMRRPWANHSCN